MDTINCDADKYRIKTSKSHYLVLLSQQHKLFTHFGFTLAEALITLGIIGVIAAMTIPTVMNNTQDAEFKNKLKKEYSVLSQAQLLIATDNGGDFASTLLGCTADGTTGNTCLKNIFKPKLTYIKECNNGAFDGICFPTISTIRDLDGGNKGYFASPASAGFILSDGTAVEFYLDSSGCANNPVGGVSRCGWIAIDVNGLQKPNKWGKDLYGFIIRPTQILPVAAGNIDSTVAATDDCIPTSSGYTCSSKYISGN